MQKIRRKETYGQRHLSRPRVLDTSLQFLVPYRPFPRGFGGGLDRRAGAVRLYEFFGCCLFCALGCEPDAERFCEDAEFEDGELFVVPSGRALPPASVFAAELNERKPSFEVPVFDGPRASAGDMVGA